MIINGRLLLLVVVTALFVRVWSVNSSRAGHSADGARLSVSQNLGPWHAIQPVRRPVLMTQAVSVAMHHAVGREEIWTVKDAPIALPAGIAPGAYRVVDDTGRVAHLEIAADHQHNIAAHTVPADFHMTTVGARRWYFIRLQAAIVTGAVVPAAPAVHEEARVERPAFTNRKFDFTGYCPAGSSIATVAEEFRPESPDLPVTR